MRGSEEGVVAFSDCASCEAEVHVKTVEQVRFVRGMVIVMDFIVGVNLVIVSYYVIFTLVRNERGDEPL